MTKQVTMHFWCLNNLFILFVKSQNIPYLPLTSVTSFYVHLCVQFFYYQNNTIARKKYFKTKQTDQVIF